jgi:O-antigen/teichoic acid export membrane protein
MSQGSTPSRALHRGRRITQNTIFLAFSELIARFSTWALIVFLGRHWAVAFYGQYAVAINWVSIFAVASELGLNALTVREVARQKRKSSFYLKHVMAIRSSFALFFWLTLIGIAFSLHYEPILVAAIAVMGLRLLLDALEGGYVYLFQAHQEMGPYALANILGAAIRLVGIVCVVSFGGQVVGASCVWVLASAFALGFMTLMGRRRGWIPDFSSYRAADSWAVFRSAVPLAAFGTLQTLYYRVDSVILKSLSGNEAVAFYDMATRVLLVVLSVSQLYSMAVFPAFASLQKNTRDFTRLVFKCSKLLFFIGLPLTVGGFFLAGPLLAFIAGPKYGASGPVFALLALSILPFFLSNIYVDILAIKNTARLNFQFAFLFLLNVVLNFILIPSWQIQGAAWATVLCEYLGVGIGFLLAAPYLRGFGKVSWIRPLAAALVSAGLMGTGLYYWPSLYWLLLGPPVYGAGLFVTGGLNRDDLADLKSVLRIKP